VKQVKNVRKSDYIQLFEYLYRKEYLTLEILYNDMALSAVPSKDNLKSTTV